MANATLQRLADVTYPIGVVPAGSSGGTATALKSLTTIVDVSAATAPSATQILTATDSTHATWQAPPAGGGAAYAQVVDSNVVTNTVAETFFTKTFTISANTLAVGSVIKLRGMVHVPSVNASDALTIRPYIGVTNLSGSSSMVPVAFSTFYCDVTATIRTIGAGGTFEAVVFFVNTNSTVIVPGITHNVAIDTTTTQVVRMSAQWGAASANNQAVQRIFVVENGIAGSNS
jgi:hypothetical protein